MDKIKCSSCKEVLPREDVIICGHRLDGTGTRFNYYRCNKCNTARIKKWRNNGGMKVAREAVLRYEAKNQLKKAAWVAAQSLPLGPCEVCGTTKNVHRHHDSYDKPMSVKMLCSLDHKRRHAELKAQGITL